MLDQKKEPCIQIVDLFLKAGFVGDCQDIANSLKNEGCEQHICDLFIQIWQAHYDLENSYTKGAMVGTFQNQLPTEIKKYIGTFFLDRKEGGRLAQTCKLAATEAHHERENQAEIIEKKITQQVNHAMNFFRSNSDVQVEDVKIESDDESDDEVKKNTWCQIL